MAKKKKVNKKKLTRVDFLREKFVNKPICYPDIRMEGEEEFISEESFDHIVDSDPSKNKQYISWMLDIYSKGRLKLEDLYKAKEYLGYIYKYKHKLQDEVEIDFEVEDEDGNKVKNTKVINPKNVSDYWDLNQMYHQISILMEMREEDLMSDSAVIKSQKEKDVFLVHEDEKWKIIVPLTQEMANLYGKGTKWCTTSFNSYGDGMFLHYTAEKYPGSRLYIIIDKQAPKSETVHNKYQFHFESKQYMDATDGRVDLMTFLDNNRVVLDALSKQKDAFALYLRMTYDVNWDGDGKVIEGDVDFSKFDMFDKKTPEGLIVIGNAFFKGSNIKIIKSITVTGNLDLVDSSVERIEGSLEVGKCLWASDSKIKEIPDGTTVGAVARFSNSKLEKLPIGMKVGTHLWLTGTSVEEIKKKHKLQVGKYLYIQDLNIPIEEVEVESAKHIYHCNIINA